MDDQIVLKWQWGSMGFSVFQQSTFEPSLYAVKDTILEIKGDGNPYGTVALRVPIVELCPENTWVTVTTRYHGGKTELYIDGVRYSALPPALPVSTS